MKTLRAALISLPLVFLLSGCGLLDYFFLPVPEDTAQELYELGVESMQEKDYYTAANYFSSLRDRYPFSPYTTQAELSLADAYFLNEDYLDAMENYMEFEAMHPRHKEMPYVLYQIGLSAMKSFVAVDRPQNQIAEGLEFLYRLRESFPDTKYAQEAPEIITRLRRILAERELFVADFYWDQDRFGPAWKRYQYVVDNFSDLPEILEYASRKADVAYLRFQKDETKQAREEIQGSWKDYFDWL